MLDGHWTGRSCLIQLHKITFNFKFLRLNIGEVVTTVGSFKKDPHKTIKMESFMYY